MALTEPGTIALVLAVGVAVGVLSAMFGVGGGVVMVPFMVLALDQSQHVAEGTSLIVVVPTAIAGVIAHRKRGFVRFRLAAMVAAGGIFGGFLGAKLALSLDADRLQTGFGAFVIIVGLKVLRDGWKLRGPDSSGSVSG